MKPAPLHLMVDRLRGLPIEDQISRLRVMVSLEKPLSVRRSELESLLASKMLRLLRGDVAA